MNRHMFFHFEDAVRAFEFFTVFYLDPSVTVSCVALAALVSYLRKSVTPVVTASLLILIMLGAFVVCKTTSLADHFYNVGMGYGWR